MTCLKQFWCTFSLLKRSFILNLRDYLSMILVLSRKWSKHRHLKSRLVHFQLQLVLLFKLIKKQEILYGKFKGIISNSMSIVTKHSQTLKRKRNKLLINLYHQLPIKAEYQMTAKRERKNTSMRKNNIKKRNRKNKRRRKRITKKKSKRRKRKNNNC